MKQNRASSFTYLNEETYLRQEFSFFWLSESMQYLCTRVSNTSSSQPSCSHSSSLIPLFHRFDVLMESFSLLLTHCTKIARKIIHMAMQKVYFHTHIAPKHLESLEQVAHQESAILSFGIAKKTGHHHWKCIPCIQFC